jgi:diaminopimelate epimerase
MRLARAHGLGNDYLVLETGEALDPSLVRAICDRHTGMGSDGILEPMDPGPCDYGVRIWNPDGSVAEKSGNGLRIFARWLRDGGSEPVFSVWTGFERADCEVGSEIVSVAMGQARFAPEDVPARHLLRDAPITAGEHALRVTALSLGNPHCVVFVEEALDGIPWQEWGSLLETHPWFPNRTNVQVARVRGPHALEIRIWERGAGPTQASGSSSCAAAAAAVALGHCLPGSCDVAMPGGNLRVVVDAELHCQLLGPVEFIGHVELAPTWLATRAASS